jgi:hypothetical protein
MKNNKNASVILTFIVLVALIASAGFFLPKSFTKIFTKPFTSTKKSGNSGGFGQLDRTGKVNKIPNQLRWKKSFVYEKEKQKRKGSYIHYLTKKNNNK